jgi:excisionase family DNA binding protein
VTAGEQAAHAALANVIDLGSHPARCQQGSMRKSMPKEPKGERYEERRGEGSMSIAPSKGSDPRRILEALRDLIDAQLDASEEPPPPPPPTFMTCEEYAERIRSTAPTVREMIRQGLPHVRPRPRMLRVKVAEADAWLEERSRRPSGRTAAHKGRIS